MNFAVLGAHRDFFRKHQWIECEQLISPGQVDKLTAGIQTVLSKRLKETVSFKTEAELLQHSADTLFRHGRDLWRENREVKKILLNKNLAEVASELIELKPLRFGYDQLLLPPLSSWQVKNSFQPLSTQIQSLVPLSLNEMSCIQGVVCGAVICIQTPQHGGHPASPSFFPKLLGNTIFFTPDFPIPFQELWNLPGYLYEMIVYTKQKAVYCLQEKDPLTFAFKEWGYNFGDALKDTLNPIVYA